MLYVEHVRDVDAATWDRLLLESPGGGHPLQTYVWGEVKATQGWTPLRLALKDGNHVLGVGQMLLRTPPGTVGKVAYCPKGPWLDWSNAAHVRTMLQGMEHFARRHDAFILKIESELPSGPGQPVQMPPSIEGPLHGAIGLARRLRTRGEATAPPPAEEDPRIAEGRAAILAARTQQAGDRNEPGRRVFAELGYVKSLWDAQFRTTMVVDLDRDPEAMLARMHSKWRYNIRLAARKGVTVEHDDSRAGRERLYEMFVRTAQRDGFMLRHKSYFDHAWASMIASGYAHIFFACHEGRPLAGLLAYAFGDKVEYRVGASESEGRNLMPAPALQFHVMKWAYERGMRCYDLVAIPNADTPADATMWGLYTFKSGFGGRPIEWAGCLDKVLDARGHAWEALEPAYYRLYKWRVKDVLY